MVVVTVAVGPWVGTTADATEVPSLATLSFVGDSVASPSADPSPAPSAAATIVDSPPAVRPADSSGASAAPTFGGPNVRPLPACAVGDLPTPLSDPSDWGLTLVDTTYAIPSSYEPPDLVSADQAGLSRYFQVRSVMVADLRDMAAAASDAGASLGIASAYRDYAAQAWTFWYWVNRLGYEWGLLSSAQPGHSEHQLGLAIDFKEYGGPDPWTYYDFATDTLAGEWLAANAWKYGFVMSYPLGQVARTCYRYEPWHYRYVGVEEAAAIRASGLTLREWLWPRQPSLGFMKPTLVEPGP